MYGRPALDRARRKGVGHEVLWKGIGEQEEPGRLLYKKGKAAIAAGLCSS
jgi:hypothetical protein